MNLKSCHSKVKHFVGFLSLLLISTYGTASANNLDHELKKSYTKEFAADTKTQLEISNKYGKVDVITWAKNAVKIDVAVIVSATNKSKAEEKISDSQRLEKSNEQIINQVIENQSHKIKRIVLFYENGKFESFEP